MKKILSAVLCVLLVIVLCSCTIRIGGLNIGISGINTIGKYTYDDPEKYTQMPEEGKTVSPDQGITELELEWISGSVTIVSGDTFTITESEEKGEYFPMYYRIDGGKASLKYAKSGTENEYLSGKAKNITITVPGSVREIELELVSADYQIELRELDELSVDCVSGNGNISLGRIKSIEVDEVSGNTVVTIGSSDLLEEIDIDQVSGNTTITLDGERGYDLRFDGVSGKVHGGFDDAKDASAPRFKIDVNTVSGDLTINKSTQQKR